MRKKEGVSMARLPVPGSDQGDWGDILNNFLKVSLASNGQIKSAAITSAGGQLTSKKGQASGYASLNSGGVVPDNQLPARLAGVGDYVGVGSLIEVAEDASSAVTWDNTTATRGDSITWSEDDPTRVHINVDGVYAVTAMVQWADFESENPGSRLVNIYANCGFYVVDQRPVIPVDGVDSYQSVNYTVFMQAGSTFRSHVSQTGEPTITAYEMMLVTRVA